MPRARECFDGVIYRACGVVQFDDESLLAFFSVQLRGCIDKPETVMKIYEFNDSADVDRPEAGSVSLNENKLVQIDGSIVVEHADPTKVELHPTRERSPRSFESRVRTTDLRTGEVVRKPAQFGMETGWAIERQEFGSCRGKVADGRHRIRNGGHPRLAQREH